MTHKEYHHLADIQGVSPSADMRMERRPRRAQATVAPSRHRPALLRGRRTASAEQSTPLKHRRNPQPTETGRPEGPIMARRISSRRGDSDPRHPALQAGPLVLSGTPTRTGPTGPASNTRTGEHPRQRSAPSGVQHHRLPAGQRPFWLVAAGELDQRRPSAGEGRQWHWPGGYPVGADGFEPSWLAHRVYSAARSSARAYPRK